MDRKDFKQRLIATVRQTLVGAVLACMALELTGFTNQTELNVFQFLTSPDEWDKFVRCLAIPVAATLYAVAEIFTRQKMPHGGIEVNHFVDREGQR